MAPIEQYHIITTFFQRRRELDKTDEFDVEDVITTSGEAPVGFNPENPWEMPAGF